MQTDLYTDHMAHKERLRVWMIRYMTYEDETEEDIQDSIDHLENSWNGSMLFLGDMYIGMNEIETILSDTEITSDIFSTWYHWHAECYIDQKSTMNLRNYANARSTGMTHDNIIAYLEKQESHRTSPEGKKEAKRQLKKIRDDGMAELDKYISKN